MTEQKLIIFEAKVALRSITEIRKTDLYTLFYFDDGMCSAIPSDCVHTIEVVSDEIIDAEKDDDLS